MKRLIPLFLIVFLWVFSTSSFSYEIRVKGNISLKEGLSGIAIDPATGMAVAISPETKGPLHDGYVFTHACRGIGPRYHPKRRGS